MGIQATAVVFEGPRQVGLREIVLPDPGDEDIVVENVYTGVSVGTEGWILRGERPVDTAFPCVPGYQQTGVVRYAGSKVEGISEGDVVNAMRTRLPGGLHYGWGGHVDRSVTDFRSAVKVPSGVSLKAASLAKLFAVGYHGVQQSQITPEDLVAVIGLGLIGQGYAQIARTRGATVVGADLLESRLDIARAYSCDSAVPVTELENTLARIKQGGADVAVDTTGRGEVIDWCVKLARQGARIVWQGWYPGRVSFEFHPAHTKRVRMIFPCSYEGEDTVLGMLADRRLTIEPLITHEVSGLDAPRAYQMMLAAPDEFLGITLRWRDEAEAMGPWMREEPADEESEAA